MAAQKYEVGRKVNVQYLNMSSSGVVRSYNAQGNYYYVYLPLVQQEILYTGKELEAWN